MRLFHLVFCAHQEPRVPPLDAMAPLVKLGARHKPVVLPPLPLFAAGPLQAGLLHQDVHLLSAYTKAGCCGP